MPLDAPDGSGVDAAVASRLDVRGLASPPLRMRIAHVLWIDTSITYDRDRDAWHRDVDAFRDAWGNFVVGHSWDLLRVVYWLTLPPGSTYPPRIYPSGVDPRPEPVGDLPVGAGIVPSISYPRAVEGAHIDDALQAFAPDVYRVYHTIADNGSMSRLTVDPALRQWILAASQQEPPLSSEEWVDVAKDRWLTWSNLLMIRLPGIYHQFLEDSQP